ncbi:uncharacterized protein TNCV_3370101 [Trichonephila clavipes]|nr:uncharacterized protein TNCV_3370101 [Trichonephila clavipes]
MPPKRSAIGRSTKQAKRRREERASETSEQRKTRQERDRVHTALARSLETSEQRQARQERDRVHTALARSLETNEQRKARQQRNRNHSTQTRRTVHTDLNLCGFNYNPLYNYSLHPSVIIGKMDKKCTYCGARKFKNETPGMCCADGKVKLPDLRSPPEPLLTLVSGSPRHMNEYAQDAMTYVRAYGRPDFFITFTCNPAWDDVKELLLTGQSPSDRHDISARVFK